MNKVKRLARLRRDNHRIAVKNNEPEKVLAFAEKQRRLTQKALMIRADFEARAKGRKK